MNSNQEKKENKNILKEIGIPGNNNNNINPNIFFKNIKDESQGNNDINITINNNNFIQHYQLNNNTNNNNNFERMLNFNNYPFDYQNNSSQLQNIFQNMTNNLH